MKLTKKLIIAFLMILFVPVGMIWLSYFILNNYQTKLLYKASGEYNSQADRGVLWKDKDINIDWGIDFEPILSEKDKVHPTLKKVNKKELI